MPYIDRDRLMELSQDVLTFDYATKSFGYFSGVSDEDIAKIPTADVVEVKHGKWKIKRDDYDCEYMMCSVCKEELYPTDEDTVDFTLNYCPNCGAKMRKEWEK